MFPQANVIWTLWNSGR